MNKTPRLRFAPSPTGGLHLGGVRTVLYNYLYARQHGGTFILRIEDTDQSRYVPGAEQYILDCLEWCGLPPDEGPHQAGAFGPYRQSERKALGIYQQYADRLVRDGHAYYAFDTPAELEEMRVKYKTPENPSPQYSHALRQQMKNSLSLPPEETQRLLAAGTPYTLRIRIEPNQEVGLNDMIRGEISFSTSGLDDKVLLKADGMPTYHLAVVVDDHLMQITHAFRGEEWLPSAPVHVLLWRWLFGEENMPRWAHLPLILKPDGNGKLSKRDGDRLGFPVFAMNWTDPKTRELMQGFKEIGFLPEAFVNLLAMLGWNDGTGQEIFPLGELIEKFSLDRVHKGGAKFDFEKAKWFNHEWIRRIPLSGDDPQAIACRQQIRKLFEEKASAAGTRIVAENNASDGKRIAGEDATEGDHAAAGGDHAVAAGDHAVAAGDNAVAAGVSLADDAKFAQVLELVKDRCTLLPDFVQQASFFFQRPAAIDTGSVQPKWNAAKQQFFAELVRQFELIPQWEAGSLEKEFTEMAAAATIKAGELLLPLRIMLVGAKFGPGVFAIAALLGREETLHRIRHTLGLLHV